MERIDSHQHFWNYNQSLHSWMTDDMQILKRNYTATDLEPLLTQCQLQGCIAVQASQTEAENEFLLDIAEKHSFIKGIVGWVDLQSETLSERLTYYSTKKKIKGFRHVIHDEPDINFMLRPAFLNGIKALQSFGFTYDILIYYYHLPNALKFIANFPDQFFVIDHMAKPRIGKKEVTIWKNLLSPLAAFPNVYCKISGMVTEAIWHQWNRSDFAPYLNTVINLFGTKRILYGSDWPVCTLSASYSDTYNIVKDYFADFSTEDQDDFFGMNAKRFYGL
jgi:L-fuconolactonase